MGFLIHATESCQESIDTQLAWYRADESRGGDVLAERWLNALHVELRKISLRLQPYGLAPENGEWLPELQIRQKFFRPWKSGVGWRVLFVIDDDAQIVTILQVRHERRRYMHEAADVGH
jgi:ParE toxin of type II toxin-antitoxin system, parDE